jgi:hypothetical protein
MQWTVVLIMSFLMQPSFAASLYKKALDTKTENYMTSGVVIGGEAGAGFSLLNVRRQHSPKIGVERVILDIGDREGLPLKTHPGFFHVSIEKKPARIVIDLSQVTRSKVTEMELVKIFSASPFIKSVELSMDAEDSAATLVFNTKTSVAVEVFQLPLNKKSGRLVIDVKKAKTI